MKSFVRHYLLFTSSGAHFSVSDTFRIRFLLAATSTLCEFIYWSLHLLLWEFIWTRMELSSLPVINSRNLDQKVTYQIQRMFQILRIDNFSGQHNTLLTMLISPKKFEMGLTQELLDGVSEATEHIWENWDTMTQKYGRNWKVVLSKACWAWNMLCIQRLRNWPHPSKLLF